METLPMDVWVLILDYIHMSDFRSLCRTCRKLRLLWEENCCKKLVNKHQYHSKEAQLARDGKITYLQALGRLLDITDAITTAQPYSIAVVAYAERFIYQEGILSYVIGNEIRILDIHEAQCWERTCKFHADATVIPLHYSEGLLALCVERQDRFSLRLLDVSGGKMRTKFKRTMDPPSRIFVRYNRRHLFFGIYRDIHGHDEKHWVIHWFNLEDNSEDSTIVYNFAGRDIGKDVCFELLDNHLYGVSVDPERDHGSRSYYQCVCIPPAYTSDRIRASERWRRDVCEGTTIETWASLSLHVDEATGQLRIIEIRREHPESGSTWHRICYSEPLPPSSDLLHLQQNGQAPLPEIPLLGPTEEDMAQQKREGKYVHREYRSGLCKRQDVLLAHTKYRTYNFPSHAFIDLVSMKPGTLQLRFNSHQCIPDQKHDSVQFWPSEGAGVQLCYQAEQETRIYAQADERSLIYSVTGAGKSAIVFISFAPHIGFPCMRSGNAGIVEDLPASSNLSERTEPAKHLTEGKGVWLRKKTESIKDEAV